jgi:chemotaxis protein methyltransferase CheR
VPRRPSAIRTMGSFTLSPPLFAIWKNLIQERTGIHYEPADQPLLESKLASRAMEAGFDSPLDYYYFLRYDPTAEAEIDALIDALVVNETYFFRETEQLTALCTAMLAPRCGGGKRLRVWCAACSTGEEPLTLAMILDGMGVLSQVDILATDIGLKALARAERGDHGERSLRAMPEPMKERWLKMVEGRARVSPVLRKKIEWRRLNLLDDKAIRALGKFDAILCRNVFIYFNDDTVQRVVTSLSAALNDGAPLLVGASESLLRFGTHLRSEEHAGSFFQVRSTG